MTDTTANISLDEYALCSFDTVRYGDTDRQGHINNAVFSTYLESGRVALLYNPEQPMTDPGASFVIARLELNFLAEAHWPGRIDIGTRVLRIGRSSVTLDQGLFQDGIRVASAVAVVVQVDNETRTSKPLSPEAVERLKKMT